MVDNAGDDLPYGQFGEAVYDYEKTLWRFERSIKLEFGLLQLGESKVAIPPAAAQNAGSNYYHSKEGPARRRGKQVKTLIQSNPELQPASGLLGEYARISEAVQDAFERYDPMKGNLIAFGAIIDQLGRASVEIIALPCGPTGSDLRIAQISKQRHGWDSKQVWLAVPVIHGEEATWKGPGAPIQSVVFSWPLKDGDSFLAVRLIAQTLVFRPVLSRKPLHGSSSLGLDPLFNLRIEQTGGSPHADVGFNPWNADEFAVVDQAGFWSVWKLKSRHNESTRQIFDSKLVDGDHRTKCKVVDDGWARIIWIKNSTTIVVCGRRKMKLFNIANGPDSSELLEVNVGLKSSVGWILDMALLPSRTSSFCVLTSSHIFVYEIDAESNENLLAKELKSFRHFRNPDDISLRLHVFQDNDDYVLLVTSNITHVRISYRLSIINASHILLGGPTELSLQTRDSETNRFDSLSLHVQPVSIRSKSKTKMDSDHSFLLHSTEQGVRFFSLFALRKNLSVLQTMYFTGTRDVSFRMVPPSWESKMSKNAAKATVDDFIVEADEPEGCATDTLFTEPVSNFIKHRKQRISKKPESEWTVNYELIVERLNNVAVVEVTDVDTILEHASDKLRTFDGAEDTPMRTLRELADGEITVTDMQRTFEGIQDLRISKVKDKNKNKEMHTNGTDELEQHARPVLRTIPMCPVLDLDFLEGDDQLNIAYQSIVDNCISPLPDVVPDVIQATKEQLAGRIAGELVLASQVLRLEEPEDEQQMQSQSQEQTWQLPVRSAPSRATPSIYFDASMEPQSAAPSTTPSSRSTSSMTGSSHPSTFAAPEIERLSRYTTFSKAAPPALPRSMQRVLSHWTPGADPATYNWLSTSRNISRLNEDAEAEEMTEKEQRRMQRRTERYLKRQRREAEEGQRQLMLSTQAPEIITASQPPMVAKPDSQPTGPAGSRQPFGPRQFPASQILPGRHGGRPPRKKRKSGF